MAATEKVGIEIELMGGQEAYNLLKRIDDQIDTLNKRKKFRSLSGLNSSKRELESYIKELGELEKKAEKTRKAMEAWGDPFKKSAAGQRLSAELEKSEKRAEEVRSQIKKMGSDMDSVTQKTRTFGQTFNSISSRVAHIGSAMQSLGNAMTRLTSPFRRLTTGLVMGAGYKALNMFTEGFSGAFERADIMKNYSRSLEAFGFSATDASKAIEELNESVLGLPTGLDEIVALQKKFVAASQDIEKSTGLAIAANNSFLASGSDARQRKTAERIISQLAGGAEIATSSWDALQRAMPLVFTTLAKESKMGVAEYMSALKKGEISTDEFIKSFSRIGREGAIADAANVMKQSWAGLTANIQNATKRMGQGIIESLNSVFEQETGRTLLQTLLGIDAEGKDLGDGIKHWIDGISESVQNWIKAHPEEILNFFNDLKNIDWKGLLKGVAEGAGEIAKLIGAFAKWASGKDMSQIGKWAVRLNTLGSVLTILGGLLKGTRHIWGLVGALGKFGKEGLLGKLFTGIFGAGGGVVGGGATGGAIGAGIGKGTFLGIGKIGLVAAEITGIVGAITTIASAFAAIDMKLISSAFNSFRKVTENLNAGLQNLMQIKSTDINMSAIRELVKKVSEVYQTLSGIPMSASVAKRMATSAKNLRNAIWQLRRAAYQINEAAGTTVNTGGFAAFVQQIKTALDELNALSQTLQLDIKVVLGSGFKSSVDGVVKQIRGARKRIQAAVDYISKKTYTTTVNVTISASVNTAGAISAIQSGVDAVRAAVPQSNRYRGRGRANGGSIYRAKGGGVGFPGRPIGTDRIPAWLTPGEYVHNRRAVNTFGLNFMRKVNNLDVKGAMNELMHRAGNMANVNRGATVNYYNNNNQRVTINNNGNPGAGFTFKSASRFVGAI